MSSPYPTPWDIYNLGLIPHLRRESHSGLPHPSQPRQLGVSGRSRQRPRAARSPPSRRWPGQRSIGMLTRGSPPGLPVLKMCQTLIKAGQARVGGIVFCGESPFGSGDVDRTGVLGQLPVLRAACQPGTDELARPRPGQAQRGDRSLGRHGLGGQYADRELHHGRKHPAAVRRRLRHSCASSSASSWASSIRRPNET
jgi:hypothetical protein